MLCAGHYFMVCALTTDFSLCLFVALNQKPERVHKKTSNVATSLSSSLSSLPLFHVPPSLHLFLQLGFIADVHHDFRLHPLNLLLCSVHTLLSATLLV